jgi:hypothetical protein
MEHINELITKTHDFVTKLGDALIKEFEKTNGVNLEVLRKEADQWGQVKALNPLKYKEHLEIAKQIPLDKLKAILALVS